MKIFIASAFLILICFDGISQKRPWKIPEIGYFIEIEIPEVSDWIRSICSSCLGKKPQTCASCKGRFKLKCQKCESGMIDCDKCDFGIYDYKGDEMIVCPKCKNWSEQYKKQVPCHTCKGNRMIKNPNYIPPKECKKCEGMGFFSCKQCSGGLIVCTECGGKPPRTCLFCKGKGYEINQKIISQGRRYIIEVAGSEFPNLVSVNEVLAFTATQNNKWRVPDYHEMRYIFHNSYHYGSREKNDQRPLQTELYYNKILTSRDGEIAEKEIEKGISYIILWKENGKIIPVRILFKASRNPHTIEQNIPIEEISPQDYDKKFLRLVFVRDKEHPL